jgi:hypothetical protein
VAKYAADDHGEAEVTASLAFDLPPSLNNAFATYNGRRIISRAYKAWKKTAGEQISMQLGNWPSIPLHYALHYRFNVNHQSDIGNREKCATDLLVAMRLIPGDQWCDRLIIERDRTVSGALVTVEAL